MTDEKTGPTTIASAIAESPVNELTGLFGSFGLDDDFSWEQRDADVAKLREAVDAERRRADEMARWTELSNKGFPDRAIQAAKKADETTAAVKRVAGWDPDAESILVLSGAPGCGKTVAATWWGSRRRRPPRFVRATTFAASSRYDRDTRDAWFSARALVLDDLGTEYLDAKGSFLVDLDELLDVFYGDRKPLLITTNCTKDAFKERYGARVVDRLRESGSWFSISDGSRRQKP